MQVPPIDLGGSNARQYGVAAGMVILGLVGCFTIEPWGRWGLLWWLSAALLLGCEAFLPNGVPRASEGRMRVDAGAALKETGSSE